MNTFTEESQLSVWQKFLQYKIVRFFLSAGIAAIADFILYYIIINFIITTKTVDVLGRTVKSHEFCLLLSYSFGVLVNFTITKFTVFTESTLKNRQQFSRFISVAFIGFFANYGLLRFFVEFFDMIPTFARVASALSLGFASYYIHKFFTFRNNKND
ncbi:GtrA family protein [Pseudopedobacter beijingensis]|uniref:GtrA family protein n=1 Tax=Pseudopedobacter beijingensis TaxID=1207056 RepID=A0ABW4IF20_9SPHI